MVAMLWARAATTACTLVRGLGGVARHRVGVGGQCPGMFAGRQHARGGTGGFLQRVAGHLGAGRQVVAAGLDLVAGGLHLAHAVCHGAHRVMQVQHQRLQLG
ncbi:hypothetical protein, partial [Comamonas aquatica]|uniref:hypothetical protein n=1 Tax=Comamonas aquatica TaxID=225991 RepID=UPI001C3F458A